MDRITKAPGRYLQGRGLWGRLGALLADYLDGKVLYIADRFTQEHYGQALRGSMPKNVLIEADFCGECTEGEAARLAALARHQGASLILGAGSGKALDTAKAAGHFADVPVALLPTASSSDAPCSALSVLYESDGRLSRYLRLQSGPAMVVADLDILGAVPPRLLAAGMGDALSTWFEARACAASGGLTEAGGSSTALGLAAARGCWDILREKGLAALKDLRDKSCTQAIADVVECCLSLSAMGFESGGLAAAHGLNNAVSALGLSKMMHGEVVAFCTLVQLRLEQAPELAEAVSFCKAAGLPTTLAALGIEANQREIARAIAEKALSDPENPIRHMPVPLAAEQVAEALQMEF